MATLKAAKAARASLRAQLTTLEKAVEDVKVQEQPTVEEVERIRVKLERLEPRLQGANTAVQGFLKDDASYEEEWASVEQYEEIICNVTVALNIWERAHQSSVPQAPQDGPSSARENSPQGPSSASQVEPTLTPQADATGASGDGPSTASHMQGHQVSSAIRVPRAKLPTFNGRDITTFPSFWDLYQAAIHNNASLQVVEKFQLLRECLSGDAAAAIAGFSTTAVNYNSAIGILRQRFGNVDFIVDKLMMRISHLGKVNNSNDIRALRKLHDETDTCLRQLVNLGKTVSEISSAFYPILLAALPNNMQLLYQRNVSYGVSMNGERLAETCTGAADAEHNNEAPSGSGVNPAGSSTLSALDQSVGNIAAGTTKLEKLLRFLRVEVENRELCEQFADKTSFKCNSVHDRKRNASSFAVARSRNTSVAFQASSAHSQCVICQSGNHATKNCTANLPLDRKYELVKTARVCFRCLSGRHTRQQCRMKGVVCTKCRRRSHYAVLHDDSRAAASDTPLLSGNEQTSRGNSPQQGITAVANIHQMRVTHNLSKGAEPKLPSVLLKTAIVYVKNVSGDVIPARALIDTGCQTTTISNSLAARIEKRDIGKMHVAIGTVGTSEKMNVNTHYYEFNVGSKDFMKCISLKAIAMDKVCDHTLAPLSSAVQSALSERGIQLSDDIVCHLSAQQELSIDIIVGSDSICRIIDFSQTIQLTPDLAALNTIFGYVLLGVDSNLTAANAASSIMKMSVAVDQFPWEVFWELEATGICDDPSSKQVLNSDVVAKVEAGVVKFGDRYSVPMPWKTDAVLDDNKEVASIRLRSLINRMRREPEELREYDLAIKQLVKDGHAEAVPLDELNPDDGRKVYYMPHKAVIRNDKSTTKRRIVFDASSHKQGSVSVNEQLHAGPNLNPEIVAVLLKFRKHEVAMTADIEKAFLQIRLSEKDKDAFRFLWVDLDAVPQAFREYRMTRLPFGATSSPFLLAFTIRHHLKLYVESYPVTTTVLDKDLYVDDLITGADSVENARRIHAEAVKILGDASMNIRKWRCSDKKLDDEFRGSETVPASSVFKVLGIAWNAMDDNLSFDLSSVFSYLDSTRNMPLTKRTLFKVCSRLFDPIGFLAPFVVTAKAMFQDLWKQHVDWDTPLEGEILRKFQKWCSDLEVIAQISVPRKITSNYCRRQVHIFSDASQVGYAAAAYIRNEDGAGNVVTHLMMAKSRIAPLKEITIPRLELLGAMLAAKLKSYLVQQLDLPIESFHSWCDSKIVLHWIKNEQHQYKQFVRNRLEVIKELTDANEWNHVAGIDNPADLPSRGVSAQRLVESDLWWHGPRWLRLDRQAWPKSDEYANCESWHSCSVERKTTVSMNQAAIQESACEPIIDPFRYSSSNKAYKVLAYVRRFIHNSRSRECDRRRGPLDAQEIADAELVTIRSIQHESFLDEIEALNARQCISKNSKVHQYRPFLDDGGIMRVGGRLQFADLDDGQKHPIILPSSHQFVRLIIRDEHCRLFHAGVSSTLSSLRQRFFILKGRQGVKKIVESCFLCKRFSAKPVQQCTAPLPAERVTPAHAFEVCGLDFAGPVYYKAEGSTKKKSYIALFTCAVSRAVHLELVSAMSTRAFMMALRRFISRRGKPAVIYSDNAKTFHRANNDLNKLFDSEIVPQKTQNDRIKWRFIAERAAWHGGFWERLVQTVKSSLRKALGRSFLSFEELGTVLVEVEAIVNSRSITYVTNDPNEPIPLSPAQLLIGRPLTSLPEEHRRMTVCSTRVEAERLFRRRQQLINVFWKRWSKEYLQQLKSAHTSASTEPTNDVNPGDVVLVHVENVPRANWPICRVLSCKQGRDGHVRQVSLRLPSGHVTNRAVQHVYKLEIV